MDSSLTGRPGLAWGVRFLGCRAPGGMVRCLAGEANRDAVWQDSKRVEEVVQGNIVFRF